MKNRIFCDQYKFLRTHFKLYFSITRWNCVRFVSKRLRLSVLRASPFIIAVPSIRKNTGPSTRPIVAHSRSSDPINWAVMWSPPAIYPRKVSFSSSRRWWWARNGAAATMKSHRRCFRASAAFDRRPSTPIDAQSKQSTLTSFLNRSMALIIVVRSFLSLDRCSWPVCRPDCVGLNDPQMHGLECCVLSTNVGPGAGSDRDRLAAFYRKDVLLTLRCLLLQWKYAERWNKVMLLESHDQQRLGTRYYQ